VRRGGDFVARIGGEEFSLLLSNANTMTAARTAERIRAEVEALGISHAGSPLGRVTISVGVAVRPSVRSAPTPENRLAFFNTADAALYRAKQRGRNRVTFGEEQSTSLAS
jgi:diguanylate cyclase (GGDEF)-like protein